MWKHNRACFPSRTIRRKIADERAKGWKPTLAAGVRGDQAATFISSSSRLIHDEWGVVWGLAGQGPRRRCSEGCPGVFVTFAAASLTDNRHSPTDLFLDSPRTGYSNPSTPRMPGILGGLRRAGGSIKSRENSAKREKLFGYRAAFRFFPDSGGPWIFRRIYVATRSRFMAII